MAELEEFKNCSQIIDYVEHVLLDESLIAQIVSRDGDGGDDDGGSYEGDEVTASVVLWETKESVDVNLNETLLKMICEDILVPKLNEVTIAILYL